MVVMISESVPGPLRRLTVAVTAADLGRLARAGACVAGLSGGAASVRSCPAAGGSCCACPGVATAVATTMLDATLSVLNWKGMKILLADKRPAPGQCQETPCNPISVTNLRPIRGDEGLCIAISRAAAIRLLPGDDRIERRKVNGLILMPLSTPKGSRPSNRRWLIGLHAVRKGRVNHSDQYGPPKWSLLLLRE